MNVSLSKSLIGLIGMYRYIVSPYLGRSCRFEPSCSDYASQAIGRFGAVRGIWLASCRLMKCQPFHPGGFDPVEKPRYTGTRWP